MIEQVAVWFILLLCVLLALRYLARMFSGKGGCDCGCGSCTTADTAESACKTEDFAPQNHSVRESNNEQKSKGGNAAESAQAWSAGSDPPDKG